MAETTTTDTSSAMTMEQLKSNAFATSMAVLGCIGFVIWANKTGKKGKFWWGLGGFLAGGAAGRVIDYMKNGQ